MTDDRAISTKRKDDKLGFVMAHIPEDPQEKVRQEVIAERVAETLAGGPTAHIITWEGRVHLTCTCGLSFIEYFSTGVAHPDNIFQCDRCLKKYAIEETKVLLEEVE